MSTPKTFHVEPESELARVLDEAGETPVVLEKGGARYRVTREIKPVQPDDLWAGYEPRQALTALQTVAGGWSGLIDTEAFKAYIAERRRTANRPSVKL